MSLAANDYQDRTADTEIYTDTAERFVAAIDFREDPTFQYVRMLSFMYCAGKLNGEAGEVAEVVFKGFREGDIASEQLAKLEKELGDVMWYVARLADLCGFTLEHIMQVNLDKLASRKERGVIQGYGDDR